MIIKNGKVLAINSVNHDDTLKGNGLSGTPLGLSQTVKEVIESKQNKLSPADNTITISNDQIKVNISGISAQQIHPTVFDPYASKQWVEDKHYLTNVDLGPYALSADVRREFDASAAWVNYRFDHIPGAEAYYGGNGINVDGHKIDLTADVVSHNELTEALNPYATQQWVEGKGYLTDVDLSDYATKEYAREASAAAVTSAKSWVESQGYLKSDALEPYAKTSDVNAQFNATSAWANDKFQVKGNYLTSADLNNYYTKDNVYNKNEVDTLLANFGGFKVVSGDAQQNYAPSLDEHGELSDHTKPNEKTIYLTKVSTLLEDNYKEWIWKGESIFDCIGIASIDLNGYVTDEELTTKLSEYYKKSDVNAMFQVTSAWANETFQPIGNYVSATDLDNYYTKSDVNSKFTETSSWATDTFQKKGNYVSATDLDNYYTKSDINDQFEDLSATVSSEYAKKTDIPNYYAKNKYIDITDDYGVSGYDWTDKINEKQDVLTIEQLSAISSVSSVQIVSGNWVTSASDIISAAGLAYFLVKDGDSSKWQGVNLATLGGSYDVATDDEALLHVATGRDENKVTFTLSAKDWTSELDEKQDKLTEEQIEAISAVSAIQAFSGNWVTSATETISDESLSYVLKKDGGSSKWEGVDLSEVGKTYKVESETPELLKVTSGDNNTTFTLSAKPYPEIPSISGYGTSAWYDEPNNQYKVSANIVGINGISAEYDSVNNQWNIGASASNLAYLNSTFNKSNSETVVSGDIIKFVGGIRHDITIDDNGYITVPNTVDKLTICVNATIDNNIPTPDPHNYMLNQFTLSAVNGNAIVTTHDYYPSEVGAADSNIAATIQHYPDTKYCVVYLGSDILQTANMNVNLSMIEEVISMSDNSGTVMPYYGEAPIYVNNQNVGLHYDTDFFTLTKKTEGGIQNEYLTLAQTSTSGTTTPVDPEVFNKLLNSVNRRIVETIPIGIVNQTDNQGDGVVRSYLFRPMIEFDMKPGTTARIRTYQKDSNTRVQIAVYKVSNEETGALYSIWLSEDKLLDKDKGEHVINTHTACTETRTIYPEELYYVLIKTRGGHVGLVGLENNIGHDTGTCDVAYYLTGQGNVEWNLSNIIGDIHGLGSDGQPANFKPYVGFRNDA